MLALSVKAYSLVIPGPNGVANSTEASLDSWTSANSQPEFRYWDNVVRVNDASGIYLGASGSFGWVLTAAHLNLLTPGSGTITVNGSSYLVNDSRQIGTQDLRLYRIGGGESDPPLPGLPNISIAGTSPAIGTTILDFGAGERVEGTSNSASDTDIAQTPGVLSSHYEWAGAGALRWGTNTTSAPPAVCGPKPGQPTATIFLNTSIYDTQIFTSCFDAPAAGGNQMTTEAGLAVGDSGGPVFSVNS